MEGESHVQHGNFKQHSTKELESFISGELMKLSIHDRNEILEELHGVNSLAVSETPELIKRALHEFSTEFDAMVSSSHRPEIQRLLQQRPDRLQYTNTDDFRIMFLRCELFNVIKAVERCLRYLELIHDVFGCDSLERPLNLSKDFDREEQKRMREGHFQLLPFRDRSGRRIFCALGDMGWRINPTTRVKCSSYMLMKAAEDVETQRRGLVKILWPILWPEAQSFFCFLNDVSLRGRLISNMSLVTRMNQALPIRVVASHICLPATHNVAVGGLMAAAVSLRSASQKCRLKFHIGRQVETKYELRGFGIPMDTFPLTETGAIKTKYLRQWMTMRILMETKKVAESNENSNSGIPSPDIIIDCPALSDVLFRSGKTTISHLGNIVFRNMLQLHLEKEIDNVNNGCDDIKKESIVEKLISDVQARDGRFVVWDKKNVWWKEITGLSEARAKIKIFVQNHKSMLKARRNLLVNESSTYSFCRVEKRRKLSKKIAADENGVCCL